MSFIFIMARSYPFWATPLAITFIGSAIVLLKNKHKPLALYCGTIGFLFLIGIVAYIVFDGSATFVQFLHENLVTLPQ